MRLSDATVLLAIIAVGFAAHTFIILAHPIQKTLGDEASYTLEAHRMLGGGARNLVPGHMMFHHRPPLGFSYFSLSAQPEMIRHPGAEKWIIDRPHDTWSNEMGRFIERVSFLNLGLLSLATLLVFLLSRECGFASTPSLFAAALMMLNPRTGFYVQSVWPEILHITLLLAAFFAFALAIRKKNRERVLAMAGWLILCGILLAYARLTRGVVGPFAWIMAGMAGWLVLRARTGTPLLHRLGAAFLAAALLLIPFEATLWPQKNANLEQHGTSLIGHNTWRNIEGGIGRTARYPAEYMEAATDPETREELARKRVLETIGERPPGDTLAQQASAFFWRLGYSYVDRGFSAARWGESGPPAFFAGVTAAFSWAVFIAGALGLLLNGWKSRTAVFLALFTLYYIAGLLVVIPNTRMYVQLVPLLLIFTAGALDSAAQWQARKNEPSASANA